MKAYSIIADSRLSRQFGQSKLDQVARMLRADEVLPRSGDLSREQIGAFLFSVFSVNSSGDAVRAAKNYSNLKNRQGKRFNGVWKQFLFEPRAQIEALNEIDHFLFVDNGAMVHISCKDGSSETFAIPGHQIPQVEEIRKISGQFICSIMLQLHQPIENQVTTGKMEL